MNYSEEQFKNDMNKNYWLQVGCILLIASSVFMLVISLCK